jgi:hypothetical protein
MAKMGPLAHQALKALLERMEPLAHQELLVQAGRLGYKEIQVFKGKQEPRA